MGRKGKNGRARPGSDGDVAQDGVRQRVLKSAAESTVGGAQEKKVKAAALRQGETTPPPQGREAGPSVGHSGKELDKAKEKAKGKGKEQKGKGKEEKEKRERAKAKEREQARRAQRVTVLPARRQPSLMEDVVVATLQVISALSIVLLVVLGAALLLPQDVAWSAQRALTAPAPATVPLGKTWFEENSALGLWATSGRDTQG